MDWHTFLVIIHLIGTVLGVGGATFSEIFLIKALKDGKIDPVESDFMQTAYRVIRVGLFLAILSGFGFLVLYRLTGLEDRLFSPILWAKLSIILIILINAILLQTRSIFLWLGSALSFASWYAAMLLVPMRVFIGDAPYVFILFWYIIMVISVAAILFVIRRYSGVKI